MTYKDNSKRNAKVSTLKDAIDSLMETYKIKNKYNEAQIIAAWEQLMGTPIVSQTTKVFVKTEILYVKLKSAPLKSELSMSKTKIVEMLNKHLGTTVIKEVIFL